VLRNDFKPPQVDYDAVYNFVAYTLDQAGADLDGEAITKIASVAHTSRVFQRLVQEEVVGALQDLKETVNRAFPTEAKVMQKEKTIERMVTMIRTSTPDRGRSIRTETSGIARLASQIESKLRLQFHSEECPSGEPEVQEALDSLLRILEYDASWNRTSMDFSGRKAVPDFVVRVSEAEIPIEVKLVDSTAKQSQVIEEMAADVTMYTSKWDSILFVVYDCGTISDVARFREGFERQGAIVLIIKQ